MTTPTPESSDMYPHSNIGSTPKIFEIAQGLRDVPDSSFVTTGGIRLPILSDSVENLALTPRYEYPLPAEGDFEVSHAEPADVPPGTLIIFPPET